MKLLLSILALVFTSGCGTIHGVPVLTALDAMGRGAAQVLGYCEDRGVDASTVKQGYDALAKEDYAALHDILEQVMVKARAQGDPIPEQTEVVFELTQQALAAHAIEQGMRAASGRNPDGSEKTPP